MIDFIQAPVLESDLEELYIKHCSRVLVKEVNHCFEDMGEAFRKGIASADYSREDIEVKSIKYIELLNAYLKKFADYMEAKGIPPSQVGILSCEDNNSWKYFTEKDSQKFRMFYEELIGKFGVIAPKWYEVVRKRA